MATKSSKKSKVKMGRPPVGELCKKRVTVSVRPKSDGPWRKFAGACRVSKGHLIEWLVLSPEAEPARLLAVAKARYFVPPDE